MRFDILTLFPEAFDSFLSTSLIGKAIDNKIIEVNLYDIREFTDNKHKKVDDVPYGGGAGMVMMCQPLFDSIEHVKNLVNDNAPVIFFTPHGEVLHQKMIEKYTLDPMGESKDGRIILLCGHYEGIDQRVRDTLVDKEISLGNFVLTGGELPAQIFIDAVSRLIPGVIGKEVSHQEESFSDNLEGKIEYPHYTRPAEFRGMKVPAVLLSGHHAHIKAWRQSQCQERQAKKF